MTTSLPPLVSLTEGLEIRSPRRRIGARSFDFAREVAVMAVVNRTPDSFYDQGRTFGLDAAVAACERAVSEGADWVDIGGVPFAPGAALTAEQELERVLPVVEAVRRRSEVVISVDTFLPAVARACIDAGADVINDTTGLHHPDLVPVVADSDATLVLTHSLAAPRTVYPRPEYADVVRDVAGFLEERVSRALDGGIPEERLVIDPGHDLNKNTLHSLELTRRLGEIVGIGLPTLVAVSNKDFVGESIGAPKPERLEGSLAAMVLCIAQGARIVRMHNVKESVAAVRMAETILGLREPEELRHNMGEIND
ncbi:dihydropteroate synthase [Labedella endophytica]|uniref:Dihydropteroate synthase n=1 Tax=Labedella endophytica TaxID=1523160 RepID=A0A433JQ04_9MICO|nr:dihydropteroate synthase [Labedella endophytica]RUQ99033.1 dihydropteroate synthase [Labedella endophytica]